MRVLILKQRNYLIASIQSVLSDQELIQLRDDDQVATDGGRHRAFGCGGEITIDATVALALKESRRHIQEIEQGWSCIFNTTMGTAVSAMNDE